jgi:hypothetical protein
LSEDVAALSHEVGEWMDDPFVDNFTPCFAEGGILEVGDPLVLVEFPGPSMASLSFSIPRT